MQFRVPQFIDVEDKIFGPFTFRQFVYLAGGAGGAYILYRVLPGFLGIPLALGLIAFAIALTFYRINEKPFIFIVEAWFNYIFQKKLFIWKQPKNKSLKEQPKVEEIQKAQTHEKKFSESRIRDIAWSLDVLDK